MKIPTANRFTLFGLVVLALVALFGVAWLSRPVTVSAGQQTPPARAAAVTVGLRACASPGSPGSHGTGLAMIAAAASHGSGQASVSRLSAAGGSIAGPLLTLSQPGVLSLSAVSATTAGKPVTSQKNKPVTSQKNKPGTSQKNKPVTSRKNAAAPVGQQGGVMVQARGSMAQGLEVEQTASGVATASCASPGTDFWFTGPGQQPAGSIQLYLMNVDNQPSVVDVDISTDAGPLQGNADTGIAVPPHGLVVQDLASLLHGSRAIELHVRTSVGRVVAAVRESSRAGQEGQWLPGSQSPARRLVIPGLPAVSGIRELYVAAPAGSDAQVKLTVVSSGGSYQPTGATGIAIPAGSASRIELPSLSGVAGAAVLTSNVPVTASLALPGGQQGAPGAFTAAVPAIQEQGVIADGGGRPGDATTVVLTAPGAAARVRVSIAASSLMSTGSAGGTGSGSPSGTGSGSAGGTGSGSAGGTGSGSAGRKGSGSAGGTGSGSAGGTGSGSAGGTGTVRLISIPARHSVTIKIGRPPGATARSGYAIVLTPLPGSGPLYAGQVLAGSNGTVLGIIPVASAPTRIPLPQVRYSLLTVKP